MDVHGSPGVNQQLQKDIRVGNMYSTPMFYSPYGPEIALAETRLSGEPHALLPEEAALLPSSASPLRRVEFSIGRAAAHSALAQLGVSPSAAVLRVPESRAPLWPGGFIGSITHKSERAYALAADSTHARGLGIDLEMVNDRHIDISKRIATAEEITWIEQSPKLKSLRMLLLFSAKESFYKAVSPLLTDHIGFHDVTLLPRDESSFRAHVSQRFLGQLPSAEEITIHYAIDQGYILSMCRVLPLD